MTSVTFCGYGLIICHVSEGELSCVCTEINISIEFYCFVQLYDDKFIEYAK